AARGIGRATARAVAQAGYRVAIHHRDSAALAESLRGELAGDGHTVVQGDLADPRAVKALVDGAAGALEGLDVVVNNAGRYAPHPITEVSYEEWQAQWRDTLDVKLVGAANGLRGVSKHA